MIITLHKWIAADREALMALCNAVDRTFLSDRLPYPYTEADADWWLGMVAENEGKEGVFSPKKTKEQPLHTTIKAILPGGFVRVYGVLQFYYRRRRAAVLDIQCILFGVVDWFL